MHQAIQTSIKVCRSSSHQFQRLPLSAISVGLKNAQWTRSFWLLSSTDYGVLSLQLKAIITLCGSTRPHTTPSHFEVVPDTIMSDHAYVHARHLGSSTLCTIQIYRKSENIRCKNIFLVDGSMHTTTINMVWGHSRTYKNFSHENLSYEGLTTRIFQIYGSTGMY